eukprot:NODE_1_length_95616_cov_0.657642.p34 type:complete len:315 gc:universal NODE_1_length_95616_cov_0.657642:77346-78290(+)
MTGGRKENNFRKSRKERQVVKKKKTETIYEKPSYNNNILKQPLPRLCKLSIALPGSIIDNCQGLQMKTIMAGQIARACAVFRVSNIYVFNDTDTVWGARFMVKVLNYLETPQYLRKRLFPKSDDMRFLGILPPLDVPHHFRKSDRYEYREGVVVEQLKEACLVDIGGEKPIISTVVRETNTRVTVKVDYDSDLGVEGVIVEKEEAAKKSYWGYDVHTTKTISEVLESEKFDFVLGTSERGLSHEELVVKDDVKNALILFGGVDGLEKASDHEGETKPLSERFDFYININPHQGSRTIRTEEAVLATLSLLNSMF